MASSKCQATTLAGKPCKGVPLVGSDYCVAHQPPEPEEGVVCGHVNRHYVKRKGEDDLTCELLPGHEGPHSGIYREVSIVNGEVSDGPARTYWSDEAGTPVGE